MIFLRAVAAVGAGLALSTALTPALAQQRPLDAVATAPGNGGRLVIADLPRIPDGPVCVKDRDWIVVEAEQFIARTTARAEELSRKAVELELAVDRDANAQRTAEDTRAELRETLRRVRDAQGYRDEARRLTTRDCLIREGQSVDLRQIGASVSGAATAQAPQAAEPAIDVRLTQPAPCRIDGECSINLVSETRRSANDDRRIAVLIDLPTGAGSFVRSSDTWNCYAMSGGAVCLAKLSQLQPGTPISAALTWRIQSGPAAADARFCARTARTTADGRPSTDPDRMRILQAVLADYGYQSGKIDGQLDGTRVVLASAAPDFGIERTSDDDQIAAALLGSMVSRIGITTGPCLQLALAPSVATAATPPAVNDAAPIGGAAAGAAALGAASGAALAAVPPRPADVVPTEPPAAKPTAPTRTTAVEPAEKPSELGRAKADPAPAKAKVKAAVPVKVVPAPTRPRAVAAEDPGAGLVVVKQKKNKVIVAGEDGGPVIVKQRPQFVAPPVSIGIGLGRKGGISFGF